MMKIASKKLNIVKHFALTLLIVLSVMTNSLNATTVIYYEYVASEDVTYKITEVDGVVISRTVQNIVDQIL